MTEDEALKWIKKQIEKAIESAPYKIDADVKPTNKKDELKVTLTRHYTKPIEKISIKCKIKE